MSAGRISKIIIRCYGFHFRENEIFSLTPLKKKNAKNKTAFKYRRRFIERVNTSVLVFRNSTLAFMVVAVVLVSDHMPTGVFPFLSIKP